MATVRNPPANDSSTSLLLPKIWVTPLKHDQGNGTLRTIIAGQSKTGAVCSGPTSHNSSMDSQQRLFDPCSMLSQLGVYIVNQSSPEACISSLQAHVQSLMATASANATQASVLPSELQAPPLLSPWPPNDTSALSCSAGSVASVREGRQCISCEGGTLNATAPGALPNSIRCNCNAVHLCLPPPVVYASLSTQL